VQGVILEFAACCRANAMRVSTAEVLDCLSQLDLMSDWDETIFHTVLCTNFSKSRREQAEFERLYRLFFKEMKTGLMPPAQPAEASDRQDLSETRQEREGLDRVMAQALADDQHGDIDADLAAFMSGNPRLFIQRVRGIHDQESVATQAVKSNLGQLTGRLEIMLAVDRMRKKVARFAGGPDDRVHGAAMAPARLSALAGQRLDRAMAFLNEDPRPDNAGLKTGGDKERFFAGVGDIPFSNLTRDEMARVTEITDRWVKKLKEISTLRFAAARKGRVDIRKTIRRSGRYLGVPVEIVRRNRPPRKGKIVTLCDISGSVWSTARFMLGILYALQSCFARVNSFVFIDRPINMTRVFDAHDVNTAVKKILKDPRINTSARTDYGLTFQTFRDEYLGHLDKKTTLIVMGDGRSNYLNPREPVLELLRERCRRLVWLNPEQERFWGTGDSEMPRYRNYCNEARACGNLNQLIDFIQELIL
jgi:uncharacterized protein with von Willebrand factor type A (vWA) domain